MKTVYGALTAIVVLLGSLAASAFTNDARWFLVGYPLGVLIIGLTDRHRGRAAAATIIGALCLIGAVIVIMRAH